MSSSKNQIEKYCQKFKKAIINQQHKDILSTKESIALLNKHNEFPYPKRMDSDEYEEALYALQVELVKLQKYILSENKKLVVVCEGRDAAGKGGSIKRFTEYLNPRHARVVALPKPSDVEHGQWYFQRYIQHLPTEGEMVFFDRSWYNRAGVEKVMNFSSHADLARFYQQAPAFESMLVESGIVLIKFWFTVNQLEQLRRFHERMSSPLKSWKLSPMDIQALDKWDDYSKARDDMFEYTDKQNTPWITINSNDKRRARIMSIRHILMQFDYPDKNTKLVDNIDSQIVMNLHS